jgi:hypothetical protein
MAVKIRSYFLGNGYMLSMIKMKMPEYARAIAILRTIYRNSREKDSRGLVIFTIHLLR